MLMLTFDDAVKVVEKIVEVFIDHSIEEDDTEYIKQELEQKCYIPEKGSAAERLSGLIMDINQAEIASMIQSDKLREWCKTIQVEMNMSLIKMDWGEMGKEPVRHGKWIKTDEEEEWYGYIYKCSVCGYRLIDANEKYCPNCGARMEE